MTKITVMAPLNMKLFAQTLRELITSPEAQLSLYKIKYILIIHFLLSKIDTSKITSTFPNY